MVDHQQILNYWFGTEQDDLAVIKQQTGLWFGKNEQTDQQIRQLFEPMIDAVVCDRRLPVQQSLAQIILLDQMTRNIYRNQGRAVAFDPLSLQMVQEGLARGEDRQLRPVERVFYYLPLEHSERLTNQNRSVELFQALADEVPEAWQEAFEGFLDYAIRHQVIIERFGRFPHRNVLLGRDSTPEELEFLTQPGSSF